MASIVHDFAPEEAGFANPDKESAAGASDEKSVEHPRKDISSTSWILTCIGLYIGAFLYGKWI